MQKRSCKNGRLERRHDKLKFEQPKKKRSVTKQRREQRLPRSVSLSQDVVWALKMQNMPHITFNAKFCCRTFVLEQKRLAPAFA